MNESKPLTWSRFAVTIKTNMPAEDYAWVSADLPTAGSFRVHRETKTLA